MDFQLSFSNLAQPTAEDGYFKGQKFVISTKFSILWALDRNSTFWRVSRMVTTTDNITSYEELVIIVGHDYLKI